MNLPQVTEVRGIRVLTTKQLAEKYGTNETAIRTNFSRNRIKFVEGKHYIVLVGDELKEFKNSITMCNAVKNNDITKRNAVGTRTSSLYLWTEKGALLHAKSLNTDKAWEVYDYLVDFYFRAKERPEPEKKEIVPVEAVEDTGNSEVLPGDTDKKPFDIAPAFRQVLTMLPTEALDEMERSFRSSRNQAVKLAAVSILAEKMKRKLAE